MDGETRGLRSAGAACVSTAALLLMALTACGAHNDEAAKLAKELRAPLTHAYGPIDSFSCKQNEQVALPDGSSAYDCTAKLSSGRVQPFCAGFANGVPAFEHTTCAESRFPRR
jgi:hypothetical protein